MLWVNTTCHLDSNYQYLYLINVKRFWLKRTKSWLNCNDFLSTKHFQLSSTKSRPKLRRIKVIKMWLKQIHIVSLKTKAKSKRVATIIVGQTSFNEEKKLRANFKAHCSPDGTITMQLFCWFSVILISTNAM